ncbi:MAG: MBL fold metallo-hydrolase [Spirochaetes bacterium]|nr:MBL fold metallo-hydrolase [Spirochaetota bacterium]
MKFNIRIIILLLIVFLIPLCARIAENKLADNKDSLISDHFDGRRYFNPDAPKPQEQSDPKQQKSRRSWISRLLFGSGWPDWPALDDDHSETGPRPAVSVGDGEIRVTLVNHSTFLIQMDNLNILTDPVWSKRVGPLSWLGVKRHRKPGIHFEDLPPIDAVLISHNHYDHMDMPTLKRLAEKFHPGGLTSLGNLGNLLDAGFESAMELDWWQSAELPTGVTVTLVPAQHFSMRSLWDRDETLWGGFVISGPSGNVYFAGDTGYGPHFKEIGQKFAPIKIAMIPIAPFRQPEADENAAPNFSRVHTSPFDAVQAHIDLGAGFSLACHFQTFQLGGEEYDAAPKALAVALKKFGLVSDTFIAPAFGEMISVP